MIDRFKYPRTMHVPGSPGTHSDDRILESLDHLWGREVVVSEKLDGENTTMTSSYIHARSIDSKFHMSREWVRAFHGSIAHEIPLGWRICGENMYAQHSIAYESLESYFYAFSIWNDRNEALSWDDTVMCAGVLGVELVPTLFRGILTPTVLANLIANLDTERQEGFVIRLTGSFAYESFGECVAKWVRAKHVQTDEHWMHKAVVPNKLRVKRLTLAEVGVTPHGTPQENLDKAAAWQSRQSGGKAES